MPKGLPRFAGPDARVADVVAITRVARDVTPIGMDVRAVNSTRDGSWSIARGNGARWSRRARHARGWPVVRMSRSARAPHQQWRGRPALHQRFFVCEAAPGTRGGARFSARKVMNRKGDKSLIVA